MIRFQAQMYTVTSGGRRRITKTPISQTYPKLALALDYFRQMVPMLAEATISDEQSGMLYLTFNEKGQENND